jgi:3'-5' exoribonuclease
VATDKNGKPYMTLVFMDKTGEIEARIWEEVPKHAGQVVKDSLVWVEGRCQAYQGRRQLVVTRVQILREDEVTVADFVPESRINIEKLYTRLLSLIETMESENCKQLALSLFKNDPDIVDRLKRAPAAKSVHHAYKGGMLEHIVSMGELMSFLASHYGKSLNRDHLLLGAFLHDIGKLWELSYERLTDYTLEGKLIGHHVIGVELIDRKMAEVGGFSAEESALIKHLIIAHHGKLEYGSPKEPHTLEALLTHYVDDLDSKVSALTQFIEADQTPGAWTALHRMYDRYFFKPSWARKD